MINQVSLLLTFQNYNQLKKIFLVKNNFLMLIRASTKAPFVIVHLIVKHRFINVIFYVIRGKTMEIFLKIDKLSYFKK